MLMKKINLITTLLLLCAFGAYAQSRTFEIEKLDIISTANNII
jgi:hypothetical protein